jgi:hypothetical protein
VPENLTDAGLADYLERNIVPEINKRRKINNINFWLTSLRSGQITGSHQWNNLATILSMCCNLYGINPGYCVSYCKYRALG